MATVKLLTLPTPEEPAAAALAAVSIVAIVTVAAIVVAYPIELNEPRRSSPNPPNPLLHRANSNKSTTLSVYNIMMMQFTMRRLTVCNASSDVDVGVLI